jgi:hypothetical protein
MNILGISLFTYHKYRKSVDSTVPLDAHGNPIASEEDLGAAAGTQGYTVELDETVHLTSNRASEEFGDVSGSLAGHCRMLTWIQQEDNSNRQSEAADSSSRESDTLLVSTQEPV